MTILVSIVVIHSQTLNQYLKNVFTCKCNILMYFKACGRSLLWNWLYRKPLQNCFKTYKYCDTTCEYCACRWPYFSSIGSILMSILTILASIESLNHSHSKYQTISVGQYQWSTASTTLWSSWKPQSRRIPMSAQCGNSDFTWNQCWRMYVGLQKVILQKNLEISTPWCTHFTNFLIFLPTIYLPWGQNCLVSE